MLAQLKLRPFYFITSFLLLVFALILCLSFSKEECFQLLNSFHTTQMDLFFIYYTIAGDGLISVAAVMCLAILKKRKEALTLLIAYISSGLFAQLLKNIISEPRPQLYFKQLTIQYNYFVNGVTLYSNNSFPSGHTTSAFAMATVIALLSNNKSISILSLFLAALVGYSRVYLAQHFLSDVLAGAFIGIVFGMLSYYFIWQQNRVNLYKALHKLKQEVSQYKIPLFLMLI